jgi:hypothetical protein
VHFFSHSACIKVEVFQRSYAEHFLHFRLYQGVQQSLAELLFSFRLYQGFGSFCHIRALIDSVAFTSSLERYRRFGSFFLVFGLNQLFLQDRAVIQVLFYFDDFLLSS